MKEALIRLTKAELWELISNFERSYEPGLPENATADRVLAKLNKAYEKVRV